MLAIGENECRELLADNNIIKLFVSKSLVQLSDDHIVSDYLAEFKSSVQIILTESSTLNTYGNWIGIKKYNNVG